MSWSKIYSPGRTVSGDCKLDNHKWFYYTVNGVQKRACDDCQLTEMKEEETESASKTKNA